MPSVYGRRDRAALPVSSVARARQRGHRITRIGARRLLHLLTTAIGTSRHFAATHNFGRFRSEADINFAAPRPCEDL